MAVAFNARAASSKLLESSSKTPLVNHFRQQNRRACAGQPCAVSVLIQAPLAEADSSTISISPAVLTNHELPAPVPSHRWGDGSGLSVEQFQAALQSLPMQQHVQWKSLYPAIGEGARGKVYEAVNLQTGGLLAVKVVPLADHLAPSKEAALRREALVLELTAMQDYQHPNLLAMKGFFFRNSSSNPRLEIYSDLGCCLEDMMPADGQPLLGLGLVQKVMAALLTALDFLHSRGVVHRDVKPGNIVSVGGSGTFKLIDMDSMFFVKDHAQQQQQHPCVQQQQYRVMGDPAPQSLSAHIAGRAAARVAATGVQKPPPSHQQQQQSLLPPPTPAQQQQQQHRLTGGLYSSEYSIYVSSDTHYHNSQHKQQQQQRTGAATPPPSPPQQQQQQQYVELNALSYAGTPENMAPEVAPVVLEPAVVMWDCIPLRPGRQVARRTAVDPAQDIWSSGTVMWELLMGRALFDDFDSPEALFQHFEGLKCSSQLPAMPGGCCADAAAVLEACLQVDPAKRPTARQLLDMQFFANVY